MQDLKKLIEEISALDKLRTPGNYYFSSHDEPGNNGDNSEFNYTYWIHAEGDRGDILDNITDWQTHGGSRGQDNLKFLAKAPEMAMAIRMLTERIADLERTRQIAIDMADDKSCNFAIAQEREAKLVKALREYVNYEEPIVHEICIKKLHWRGMTSMQKQRYFRLKGAKECLSELGIETGGE